ncbi:MAG: hypothetical protein SV775_08505 [Thermodesulfobacteriota bacterium]|nr:hypothetical protein [Thermodesulfobacteriota bacterium]
MKYILRIQYDRPRLVTNNSRFLILADWHFPKLASRVLIIMSRETPGQLAGSFRLSGCAVRDLFCGPSMFPGTQLPTVSAIVAGVTLCVMRSYLAISNWAKPLGKRPVSVLGCRYRNSRYIVPSPSIIRDVLIRVDPLHLDCALQRWN